MTTKPTEAFVTELRKWWSFDDRQQHAHSWHSREEFIEKKLPALLAAFQLGPAGERATMEQLKQRIDTRLNDYLCEMKPDYDDSICGFNEAWDIVRKVFADAPSPPQPARSNATGDQWPTEDELAQVLYYNNYTATRSWDQALEPYKSEAQADASAVHAFLIKWSQSGERE